MYGWGCRYLLQNVKNCHGHHCIQNSANDGMDYHELCVHGHFKTIMMKRLSARLETELPMKTFANYDKKKKEQN